MFVTQLALVSESTRINPSQLNRVAAALQKQATRDLSPLWGIDATVDAFAELEDVPVGYWPLIVVDDVPDAAGFHHDENGQPFSLIEFGDSWSLTASHEMLEMLVDPWGNRLVPGKSPKPDQGLVEFLVEVADPSEDAEFGYTVNGMLVSDFYTQNFYDPVVTTGTRYSFGGHISEPRQVLPGGYLSWREPITDHWWQQTWFEGNEPKFRHLGRLTDRTSGLRAAIDAMTKTAPRLARRGPVSERYAAATVTRMQAKESTGARAEGWRGLIAQMRSTGSPEGGFTDGGPDRG
ncbi:hypothetical protein OG883_11235 [Streptomyces sp. NBC_01142]|uniref:hypothetical protein n=1 Tax=Streptomyces sp. NBC_01142 TaxID=2975865 RepID=UPI00225AA242|nr:hypothetical protein [Streptomyces sp. NBC_01142]MCX4820469.1 hypothetical protein [Streptomyces sp. NBC_01142]